MVDDRWYHFEFPLQTDASDIAVAPGMRPVMRQVDGGPAAFELREPKANIPPGSKLVDFGPTRLGQCPPGRDNDVERF
jgi:hypothetical protein